MRIAKKTTPRSLPELLENDHKLGAALVQGLNLPLSALRASMEGLFGAHTSTESERTLPFVMEEVDRLTQNVQDLIAYANPATPQPLRCTLDEITQSARDELPSGVRPRVVQARHDRGARALLDGPMISRCLRRLIQNAIEAGAETVLVISRLSQTGTSFAVIDASPETFDADWNRQSFHTTRKNQLGLGLSLVERDIEMMGGVIEFQATELGTTCIQVTIPTQDKTSNSKNNEEVAA